MAKFLHCFLFSFLFFHAHHTLANKRICQDIYTAKAQHQKFERYTLFNPLNTKGQTFPFSNVLSEFQLCNIHRDVLQELVYTRAAFIQMDLPFRGIQLTIDLHKATLFTDDFGQMDSTQDYHPGAYYRGVLSGDSNSLVAISFFENGDIYGIISSPEYGNIVVAKLEDGSNSYILYQDDKLTLAHNFSCDTKDEDFISKDAYRQTTTATNKCVRFYYEVDYDIYKAKGYSVTSTKNWMTAVHNNVATLYSNDDIDVALSDIYVWTTLDPYNNTTSSEVQLNKFANYRTSFNGDVAQLVGIDGPPGSGLGGIAADIDILCGSNNYTYSDVNTISYANVPTYSWTIKVITHEFGHALGSPHTHDCVWNGNNTAIDGCGPTYDSKYRDYNCPIAALPPYNGGTIMSYCHLLTNVQVGFSKGFGPQPAALIRNTVNNSFCLSSSCTGSSPCAAPTSYSSSNSTNSAYLNWNDVGNANYYYVRHRTSGGSWTYNTATLSEYNLTGLQCGTAYEYQVSTVCTNGNASDYSSSQYFNTTACAATCTAPTTFSWSIGSTTAYLNWNDVATASYYIVYYKPVGGSYQERITYTSDITLSDLLCNTSYNWDVATQCTNGYRSPYSVEQNFTTSTCPCSTPVSLYATPATNAVTLNWNMLSNASYYVVRYRTSGGSWNTYTSYTNSATISGLSCNTYYEWQVSTTCNNGNTSDYSSSSSFTTLACTCGTPIIYSTSWGSTDATLDWSDVSNASSYTVRYRANGGTWSYITAYASTVYINTLSCNTYYEWQVYTTCNNGSTSGYSSVSTFTTMTCPCGFPTSFTSTAYANGAMLSWQYISNASNYLLRYRSNGGVWNTVSINTAYTTLYGLNCNTTYEWQIATVCNNGVTSIYSSSQYFTTLACTCPVPSGLNNYYGATYVSLTWNTVANVSYYNVVHRQLGGTWYTYTTTNAYLEINDLACNTNYEWYVNAVCSNGAVSENTPTNTYTTYTCCPSKPTLNSPANYTTVYGNDITFTWNKSSGATSYIFEISRDATFQAQKYIFTNAYESGGLMYLNLHDFDQTSITYYWRVKAVNPSCTSSYSDTYIFYSGDCGGSTIYIVPLYNPIHDTTVDNTSTIYFNWGNFACAYQYHFQVSEYNNFTSSNQYYTAYPYLYYTWDAFTLPNKTFYWRVKQQNINGWGEWSSTNIFHTKSSVPLNEDIVKDAIKIFPNPTDHTIQISIDNNIPEDFYLHIIDIIGKIVVSKHHYFQKEQTYTVDVSALAKGLYVIRLLTNDKIYDGKFEKL